MEKKHRKILDDNSLTLSLNCNFENLLGFLREKNVFLPKQLDKYENDPSFSRESEERKCQILFKDIQSRGPKAFENLLECFKRTGHTLQYEKLTRASHLLKNEERQAAKVKKTSQSFAPSERVYKMLSFPKGYYIFINNLDFTDNKPRYGAEKDQYFTEVLDDMGFKGEYYENKTVQEMKILLHEFCTKEELATVDSCIVAISSHGHTLKRNNELLVQGCDGDDITDPLIVKDMIDLFASDECKLPKGQPKIFIIQACRGEGTVSSYGDIQDLSKVAGTHHPWQDTILIAPCFQGLRANRNKYGSWLFQALTEVFSSLAHSHSLSEMINSVGDVFDKYYEESLDRQQTPSFYEYGVHKSLYFNPGHFERSDPHKQLVRKS